MKIGDTVTISGLPVHRKIWWQIWKRSYTNQNGKFAISSISSRVVLSGSLNQTTGTQAAQNGNETST